MLSVFLLTIVGGIGFAQAVSDPYQVTLRWLRLGGLIAAGLLAVSAYAVFSHDGLRLADVALLLIAPAILVVGQLIAVQCGKRVVQRVAAAACWVVCFVGAFSGLMDEGLLATAHDHVAEAVGWPVANQMVGLAAAAAASASLLGGLLMTMLLGHAYLTAGGEMTQAPFRRLVLVLAALLVVRAALAVGFGAWPYFFGSSDQIVHAHQSWATMMIASRFAVGLIVPGVFIYMIDECVRRRANQSATGILYVATVLVWIGEGIGWSLLGTTGLVF